jgi:hypothetical protein
MSASLKAKLIAGFTFAFLAGGAAGAFFTFHHARQWREDFQRHSHSLAERMRDRIKQRLELTPEQTAKVDPILDHAVGELQKIRAETGARVGRVMSETNQAVQPFLTDAQREKLEKMERGPHKNHGLRKPGHRRALPSPSPGQDGSES